MNNTLKIIISLVPIGVLGFILFFNPRNTSNERFVEQQTETNNVGEQETMFTSKLANQDDYAIETREGRITELEQKTLTEGEGDATVPEGATVVANYRGWLATTGEVFDESFKSTSQGIEFGLNQVIEGWTTGVVGMKVGEVRRLYIPAELGYGSQEVGSIPANSDLIFDVELVQIK